MTRRYSYPLSPRRNSPVQDPEPGSLTEALSNMSVKELKQILKRERVDSCDLVTCVEKSELVELVLKLHARKAQ
jgi:hypothetical protein